MHTANISRARFTVILLSCSLILVPPGGLTYSFNCISPYLLSYLRSLHPSQDTSKELLGWVYAALLTGQGISMILGGVLERYISTRRIALFAVSFFNLNLFLLYWGCSHVVSLIISYLCTGLALGLLYITSLVVALSWVQEQYRGLAAGIACLGYGLSSTFISPLETIYINPLNLQPTLNNSTHEYTFTQEEVIGKVPGMFVVFAVLSSVLQLPLACALQKNPDIPADCSHKESLRQMIRKPEFYLLFVIFGLNKVPLAFIGTYTKFYGETFLSDDMFLSVIAGLAGLFNALGRPFWGAINDTLRVKKSLILVCVCTGASLLLVYTSKFLGDPPLQKTLYSISVWACFFSCSGNYAIMPAATAHLFGIQGLGVKYGILYLSQGVGALLAAALISLVPFWAPLVLTIVVVSLVSGFLALALDSKNQGGRGRYFKRDSSVDLMQTALMQDIELTELDSG